eukprot:m51a1_g13731 putative aldose 1-epimerase (361) ;mRNA; r:140098-141844
MAAPSISVVRSVAVGTRTASVYRLSNGVVEADVTDYGAILMAVRTPDRHGLVRDVLLGFDGPEEYVARNSLYFGSTVGRYCNRIRNGKFELLGKQYELARNNGENHLHGGVEGFDRRMWAVDYAGASRTDNGARLVLSLTSPAGDQGYPGELHVTVTFHLAATSNELSIGFVAQAPKEATIVNLTNHAYFNLAGEGCGDVLNHVFMIDADTYVETDATMAATGKLLPVQGTPMDLRTPAAIAPTIDQAHVALANGHGYDHNYVLNSKGSLDIVAARVVEPKSGRVLEVRTTQPGVQFYSGNWIDINGKGGKHYTRRTGFCLETQHFPDSPNHKEFPTTELHPGKTLHEKTVFKFTVLEHN